MKKPQVTNSPWNLAKQRKQKGLSLIELLVSVTLVAILGGVGGAAYSSAAKRTALTREMNAAKTLMTAYHTYAADHSGRFLLARDLQTSDVQLPTGEWLSGGSEELARYPFRLAAYFDYKMDGTVLLNNNRKQIKNGTTGMSNYGISLYPAFGLNGVWVGGSLDSKGQLNDAEEVTSRQAGAPGGLLVFASAGSGQGQQKVEGYVSISSPYSKVASANWGGKAGSWKASENPANYGHIDARHDGKAVCAFLDGSVRLHTVAELADMRLWSKRALEQNKFDYVPASSGGGGRR